MKVYINETPKKPDLSGIGKALTTGVMQKKMMTVSESSSDQSPKTE